MQDLETIQQQWAHEIPDLDTSTMALIGRLQTIHKQLTDTMSKTFRRYGLTDAGFDVIATLRRSGSPYRLTPNQLLAQMLVTSGSMTSRLSRLQKQGWISRSADPDDRRVSWVQLTEKGLAQSEEVLRAHVATQQQLLAPLDDAHRKQLTDLLSAFESVLQ